MKLKLHTMSLKGIVRMGLLALVAVALLSGTAMWNASDVSANHPVLVEGEQDFDGDGMRGTAEDTDNMTDRIFGTISAALLGANGGANANGLVLIVTSGRFPEQLLIPNTAAMQANVNGVTIVEAAPGVAANIDAVLQGDANNGARQAAPGIVINTMSTDRVVVLRNLIIRNWTEGIQVNGAARVIVDRCRLDSNLNFGLRALGTSRVTVLDSTIVASGMRFNPMMNMAGPGTGVRFEEMSTGAIIRSTVAGNTATGVNSVSGRNVFLFQNTFFDNGTNFSAATGANIVNLTSESQLNDVQDSLVK